MIFQETKLEGAFVIQLEKIEDERGFFARAWCKKEFAACGLDIDFVQANIAFNPQKNTLRGMHYQVAPDAEAKLVRCIRGAIWDVIVDLRPDSPSFCEWTAVELSQDNHRMLFIPENFAHGYLTLIDNSEVFYHVSQFYAPQAERGVGWNDPAFNISWPQDKNLIISEKDKSWPLFSPDRRPNAS